MRDAHAKRLVEREPVLAGLAREEGCEVVEVLCCERRDVVAQRGILAGGDRVNRHSERRIPVGAASAVEPRAERDEREHREQQRDADRAEEGALGHAP